MVLEDYRDFQEYILDDINSWIMCDSAAYLFSPKGWRHYFTMFNSWYYYIFDSERSVECIGFTIL